MSDPKEPERREVTPDGFTVFIACVAVLAFSFAVSQIRGELRRIVDALERAHPAPEVGK